MTVKLDVVAVGMTGCTIFHNIEILPATFCEGEELLKQDFLAISVPVDAPAAAALEFACKQSSEVVILVIYCRANWGVVFWSF